MDETGLRLCLIDVVGGIDQVLGRGYAKAHPELTGACVQAMIVSDLVPSLMRLADNVRSIAEAVGKLQSGD